MKKVLSVCSVLSGIISVLSLIFGIRALTGRNFFISLRLFNMAANGTFFGFIGNILGIAVTCLGFGAWASACWRISASARTSTPRKRALSMV